MALIAFHDPRLSSISGGAETVTLQLVRFLLNANHRVTVVTRKAPRSALFQAALNSSERLECVELPLADASRKDFADDSLLQGIWDCDRLAPESVCFNLAAHEYYQTRLFDLVVVSFIPDLGGMTTESRILLNVFGLPPNKTIARIERSLLDHCAAFTFASGYIKQQFAELFELPHASDPGPVVHASVHHTFFNLLPFADFGGKLPGVPEISFH